MGDLGKPLPASRLAGTEHSFGHVRMIVGQSPTRDAGQLRLPSRHLTAIDTAAAR
jgi:hypothetical protein